MLFKFLGYLLNSINILDIVKYFIKKIGFFFYNLNQISLTTNSFTAEYYHRFVMYNRFYKIIML